jgi:hypothetical protein
MEVADQEPRPLFHATHDDAPTSRNRPVWTDALIAQLRSWESSWKLKLECCVNAKRFMFLIRPEQKSAAGVV